MGYSNYDVAHRYATGIGTRCTGHNMFFEGDVIYSYGYHFPMAIKYKGYLLFTEEGYSNTTAKHKSIVYGACSHYDIVSCATLKGWFSGPNRHFYNNNFEKWETDIKENVEKMGRAIKPGKYASEILRIVKVVERFCDVFGQPVPNYFVQFKDEKTMEAARNAAKIQAKKEADLNRKLEEKMIQKFIDFECDYYVGKYQIVRYREEKNRFETSKRVQIPYEIGLEFYRKLRDGLLKVGDRVLYYTVRSVGKEVNIGCHTFKQSWLLEYGKKMFKE